MNELFFKDLSTGETFRFGDVKDIELTTSDSQEAEPYLRLNSAESFSGTFKVRRSLVYQLDVIIGHKYRVPNNWLKRHRIPMNRKGG